MRLTQVLRILPRLGRPEHGLKVIVLRCRGINPYPGIPKFIIPPCESTDKAPQFDATPVLGQLLSSMSFSDIANNKGRFHCE